MMSLSRLVSTALLSAVSCVLGCSSNDSLPAESAGASGAGGQNTGGNAGAGGTAQAGNAGQNGAAGASATGGSSGSGGTSGNSGSSGSAGAAGAAGFGGTGATGGNAGSGGSSAAAGVGGAGGAAGAGGAGGSSGAGDCSATPGVLSWTSLPDAAASTSEAWASLSDGLYVFKGYGKQFRRLSFADNTWSDVVQFESPSSVVTMVAFQQALYALTVRGAPSVTQVERWQPGDTSWTKLVDAPAERQRAPSVVDGGVWTILGDFTGALASSVIRLDLQTLVWSDGPDLPFTPVDHAVVVNGDLFVVGNASVFNPTKLAVLRSGSNQWENLPSLPDPRARARLIHAGNSLWLLGGASGATPQDSIFRFDMIANDWCEGATLGAATVDFAVAEHAGQLYTVGGEIGLFSTAQTWRTTLP